MSGAKTSERGITRLPDGRYQVRVWATHPTERRPNGEPRQCSKVETFEAGSLRDAKIRKLELETAYRASFTAPVVVVVVEKSSDASAKLFSVTATEWLAALCSKRLEEDPQQPHLLEGTQERYGANLKALCEVFGNAPIGMITKAKVEAWRLALVDQGYMYSYINTQHRVLRSILGAAGNRAAHEVKYLNVKARQKLSREEPNALDVEELDRFLAAARRVVPEHYALILVLFTALPRISTALELRWTDFDLRTREIVFQRRLTGSGVHRVVRSGIKRGRFDLDTPPLHPVVWDFLLEHQASYSPVQAASGLVFPSRDGRAHSRTILDKPFKKILKAAGIRKRLTPHGCRRTGEALYGSAVGTRIAMLVAGHLGEKTSLHYQAIALGGINAREKLQGAHQTFDSLRLGPGGTSNPPQAV